MYKFKQHICSYMNTLRQYSQRSFRQDLIKRDQCCILSGLSAEVCEAAHIVNKEWLRPDSNNIRFTNQNGILLNRCLHKEFDLHFWSIDICENYTSLLSEYKDTSDIECGIKLYPPAKKKKKNNLKLAIFDYTTITIPVVCIPFFKERNEFVRQKVYNKSIYTSEDIQLHIKDEFKYNRKCNIH